MSGAPRHDMPLGGRSGFVLVDFMTAHKSFAAIEEPAMAISEYLPQRKAVRPESLTRNLRQRADGRWERKQHAGHLAVGDNPQSTTALVRSFLERLGWATSAGVHNRTDGR